MAFRVSTGLRNYMLATGSFKTAMDSGFLKLYSGSVPASADDSLGAAVLLVTISLNSTATGITFETTAVSGVLSKKSSETWSGVVAASGTASFFRFIAVGDTGVLSTTEKRVQGSVGVAASELNLSSVALTSLAVQTINHFNVALPTL